jgi:hypothetical protein
MENKTDDIEIYVVERRLFRSSRENEIVGAFCNYREAVSVRDALPDPGGKITAIRLDSIELDDTQSKLDDTQSKLGHTS